MGTAASQNSNQQQNCQALSSYTPEDIRILEWRSNPQFNEFIPKVIFQYQETQKTGTFITQCHHNQNLPLGVRHQKFIGNLTILTGKLSFEETLYTIKSLLSGHQSISTYFGKTVVSPSLCFLTKQGEVKAWFNEDYRRNTFSCQIAGLDISKKQEEKLFLKPQEWIDQNKLSSSQANIIQKILFLAAELTYQEKEFNQFLQTFDAFITADILKNLNFDRVKKFVNKYIYQKKIFVKSNLLETIQRLYYEHVQEQEAQGEIRSVISRESHLQRKPSQMSTIPQTSTIREQREPLSFQVSPFNVRNHVSPQKRSFVQEFAHTKNSQFFNSTAYTNTNKSSNFMQSGVGSYHKDGPVYASYCMSHTSAPQFPDSVDTKLNFNKNHISPQYCMNFSSVTAKVPVSLKRMSSLSPSPKSSFISSKSSNKNIRNVEFKMGQSVLRMIPQRKQTDPQEKYDITNRARQEELKKSLLSNNQSSNFPVGLSFGKRNHPQIVTLPPRANIVNTNKTSCVSIVLKGESNPHQLHTKTVKPLKSTCDSNDKQKSKSAVVSEGMNTQSQKSSFVGNMNETNQNFFTMKIITRLISSNENMSEQQQSEGDFPSLQNESSYSGILASMGRSAVILDVPEVEKPQFRTSKKQQTIFTSNQPCSIHRAEVKKSYDAFIKKL